MKIHLLVHSTALKLYVFIIPVYPFWKHIDPWLLNNIFNQLVLFLFLLFLFNFVRENFLAYILPNEVKIKTNNDAVMA